MARHDHLPGELRTHWDGAARSDHEHRGVRRGECCRKLAGEVLEAGNVDEVDAVAVPVEVSQRRTDAHRAALLLRLVVEDGGALLRRAHPRGRPGDVEERLAQGRLAVVAVADHSDGPDSVGRRHRHGQLPSQVADGW